MPCCKKNATLDTIYTPISKRLIEFGNEVYGEEGMSKYKETFLWIFSFYDNAEMCEECKFKFSAMSKWFSDYGMFKNVTRNVKWILEDEPTKNLIFTEMGLSKTPIHIFTDSTGKILDMVVGFPTIEWLESYILPLIQEDMNYYG